MIRINLLPSRKTRTAGEGGKLWAVVLVAALVVELVAIAVVYVQQRSALAVIERRNADARARTERIQREVADHDQVKKALEEIRSRDEVISKLRSGRTGPVFAMMELSKILSPGGLPTTDIDRLQQIMRDNPLQAPNQRWDARRLWLTEFKEQQREVTLKGAARGHDDVAELLRRLILSDYFTDERLQQTESAQDPTGLPTIAFEIHATVRYH